MMSVKDMVNRANESVPKISADQAADLMKKGNVLVVCRYPPAFGL